MVQFESYLRRVLCKTRLIFSSYKWPYVTDMLSSLKWRSLELRRSHARLCMLYKQSNGLATYEYDKFQRRIRTPCSRLSVIDFNSYVVHVIIIRTLTPAWWNNLPPEIIASTSLLRTFRQSLCNLTY